MHFFLFCIFGHMKKAIYFMLILLCITACQRNQVVKTHGISYLEKRAKLIILNQSNKNDVIKIFGQPSTKGMTDDELWIYIERSISRKSMLRLGKNYLQKNNVLVLEFDQYGVLNKKDFYNKENMNKLTFAKNITENEIRNLLKKCDLEWNKQCLKFYDNRRAIKTASDIQARNKIYNSSIDSWKKYEKHLKKYFVKLNN